ncbi:MAG: hypothetical protein ACP5NQ_02765 [Vulcanisaeta sp.]
MRRDQESKVINTINDADNNGNIYYDADYLSNTVSMIIIPTPYALPIIIPMYSRLSNNDMRKLLQSHYYVLP